MSRVEAAAYVAQCFPRDQHRLDSRGTQRDGHDDHGSRNIFLVLLAPSSRPFSRMPRPRNRTSAHSPDKAVWAWRDAARMFSKTDKHCSRCLSIVANLSCSVSRTFARILNESEDIKIKARASQRSAPSLTPSLTFFDTGRARVTEVCKYGGMHADTHLGKKILLPVIQDLPQLRHPVLDVVLNRCTLAENGLLQLL